MVTKCLQCIKIIVLFEFFCLKGIGKKIVHIKSVQNIHFFIDFNYKCLFKIFVLNPVVPSVLNIERVTKIFISVYEGIIKKISYERRTYESVDEESLS